MEIEQFLIAVAFAVVGALLFEAPIFLCYDTNSVVRIYT